MPNTMEGNMLLAHELTHVVQQSTPTGDTHSTIDFQSGSSSGIMISRQEAERVTAAPGLEGEFEDAVNVTGDWDKAIDRLTAFWNDDRPKVLAKYVKSIDAAQRLRQAAVKKFGEYDLMITAIDTLIYDLKPQQQPRSLSETIDPNKWDDERIIKEIGLIRKWIDTNAAVSNNTEIDRMVDSLDQLGRILLRRHPDILERTLESLNQTNPDVTLALVPTTITFQRIVAAGEVVTAS